MLTKAEKIYWKECWPEALLYTIQDFMANNDITGILGISSFAVCHRKSVDCEAAVSSLIQETIQGLEEAKKIREDLNKRGLKLKELGLYDAKENRAELLERGLVSVKHLDGLVSGYRRTAREVYSLLKEVGLLKEKKHSLSGSSKPITYIGLNTMWNDVVEEIETTGKDSFTSSLSIMLCMAIHQIGTTTVIPMVRGTLIADHQGGEIKYEDLKPIYGNVKTLNIIRDRDREKVDALKIFSSDDGKRLILNPNVAYAIGRWQREANRLAQTRGLGVR